MPKEHGLTVVELLVAVAIVVTLTSLAMVPMERFVERHRSAAAINRLIGAVHFARHAAIVFRAPVQMCPRRGVSVGPDPSTLCGGHGDWHFGQVVFVDRDRDQRFGAGDDLLRVISDFPEGSQIHWRSFRNRPYLTFEPSGYTAWQNGHFLYCPASLDPHDARQVVLNPQGRLRQMADRNGDGIVEDTNGRPLRCDSGQ